MAEYAEGSDGNAAVNADDKTPLIWQLAGERGFLGNSGTTGIVKSPQSAEGKSESLSVPEVQIEKQPVQEDRGFVPDMSKDQLLDFIGSGELSKMVLNSPTSRAAIQKHIDDEAVLSRQQGLSNMPLIGCFKTDVGKKAFGEYSTAECLRAKLANW